MKKKIVISVLSLLMSSSMLFACKGLGINKKPPVHTAPPHSEQLLLSETEKELVLGDEAYLSVYTYAYRDDVITWTSSDNNVVSVNDGLLTANGVGMATITATATDGMKCTCNVNVVTGGNVPVLDFEFDDGNGITLLNGEKFNFEGFVLFNGKTYTDSQIRYHSSNPAIGTMQDDGVFTATAVGTTKITVSASWRGFDSASLTKTFVVNVKEMFVMQYETLDAQFHEVVTDGENAGKIMLDTSEVEGTITSVSVDGTSVGVSATFAYATVGRHTAIVQTEDVQYTIPFVYADFVINEASELTAENIATYAEKYIVLADNIDYKNGKYTSTATLKGTFDGYGHTISNITITAYGLFKSTSGATIKDFALVNVNLSGNGHKTAIAGTFNLSTLENVFVVGTATPYSNYVTTMLVGIVGNGSTIKNCMVIDNSNLSAYRQCALGLGKGTTTGTFVNTVAVTTGTAVASNVSGDTEDYCNTGNFAGGVTKTSELTATMLETFADSDTDERNVWSFDDNTNTLYLNGNAIYTIPTVTE